MTALTGSAQRGQIHRQEVGGGGQVGGGDGESVFNGEHQFGKTESSGDGWWGHLHNDVNKLNDTEL